MSDSPLMSESFKATIIFFNVKIVRWGPALLSRVQGQAIAEHVAVHYTSASSVWR